MLDCVISIPGNGVGKYGRYKKDKTGPVSQFCIHNSYLYGRVYSHFKGCRICDPNDALRLYLKNRKESTTSVGLVGLALKYEKAFKIDKAFVDEFIIRCYSAEVIVNNADRLDPQQTIRCARLMLERSGSNHYRRSDRGQLLFLLMDTIHEVGNVSDEELLNLASVHSVIHS